MQDNPMQAAMQPLIKLTQANMELITKFSMSPELLTQAMSGAQNLLQPGQLAQSNAFAQLTQGLMKNYSEFAAELTQSGMAALSQGQAEITRRAQEAGDKLAEATGSPERGKRPR